MSTSTTYPPSVELDIETVQYELRQFHTEITFDPSVMAQVKAETFTREHTRMITWRLLGIVALWREQRILKTPANWWEHFKQRWFPRWALKRWPVLYEWHDAGVVLPKVPIGNPAHHTVNFPVWIER